MYVNSFLRICHIFIYLSIQRILYVPASWSLFEISYIIFLLLVCSAVKCLTLFVHVFLKMTRHRQLVHANGRLVACWSPICWYLSHAKTGQKQHGNSGLLQWLRCCICTHCQQYIGEEGKPGIEDKSGSRPPFLITLSICHLHKKKLKKI